ncbi:protein prenylyltransferase [Daldinia caldariorum]|uniref:protein prenylyltransferase n=1 Tax=Daldinia caldariorum TaxID=326644 RepID=UPI002008E62C|nr:protein prenylyltransferase [Daldinia caldariorum]KAI1471846.1 protein prenylyltransferase [Daldinia caldariorum]
MDSHGAARTARTARTEEQRRQDLDKIAKYRHLEDSIRAQALANNYDSSLFQLTSKLLRLNPEYYTIWNVRRRCLISAFFSAPSRAIPPEQDSPSSTSGKNDAATGGKRREDVEADVNTLQSELAFTIPLLLEFPKCYWIWKYRRWLLEQAIVRLPATVARHIWEAELALASKMLTKDRRNFHAWGYRRNVVAMLESPSLNGKSMVEEEFAYTTRMINGDLSNFSAWHSRSQLILRLLDERDANDAARKIFLEEELDLVREALNVGPEDQSLWYYHQYLVSQIVNRARNPTIAPALTTAERTAYVKKEIDNINDLLEDYEDVKWIYESLLEYTIALKSFGEQVEDPAKWLAKVRALDPMRAGRWDDVEKQLGATQH